MREAFLNGWQAHRIGVGSDCNPYHEKTQGWSHNQWIMGWCARFDAIKHGGSRALDQEDGCTGGQTCE